MMRFSLLICPAACLVAAALLWMGGKRMDEQLTTR
jgi:hypothetical protein